MDLNILKSVGQIAGIGGIALGVLLLLFRDVIRKDFLSNLTRENSYKLLRMIIILTWSIALSGVVAWTYVEAVKNNYVNPSPSGTISTPKPTPVDPETKCIDEQTEILNKTPNYTDALYERGGCYQRRKKDDDITKAINDYSKVVELDKSSSSERADVYQNRANAFEARNENGDMERAITDYTQALNLAVGGNSGDTNKYDILKDRGYAYSKMGKRNLMIVDFKKICSEAASSGQCSDVKGDIQQR